MNSFGLYCFLRFLLSISYFLFFTRIGSRRYGPRCNLEREKISVSKMLYPLLIGFLTFFSSFMTADALRHVFLLPVEELSLVFFSIWSAAVILSLLDKDWVTSLGFFHVFIFLICAVKVYRGNYGGHEKDFIKVPLTVFTPLFLVVFCWHLFLVN